MVSDDDRGSTLDQHAGLEYIPGEGDDPVDPHRMDRRADLLVRVEQDQPCSRPAADGGEGGGEHLQCRCPLQADGGQVDDDTPFVEKQFGDRRDREFVVNRLGRPYSEEARRRRPDIRHSVSSSATSASASGDVEGRARSGSPHASELTRNNL